MWWRCCTLPTLPPRNPNRSMYICVHYESILYYIVPLSLLSNEIQYRWIRFFFFFYLPNFIILIIYILSLLVLIQVCCRTQWSHKTVSMRVHGEGMFSRYTCTLVYNSYRKSRQTEHITRSGWTDAAHEYESGGDGVGRGWAEVVIFLLQVAHMTFHQV